MKGLSLFLLAVTLLAPRGDALADAWVLGMDSPVNLDHIPCECELIVVDFSNSGILAGRRWDSGWSAGLSASVSAVENEAGSSDGRWLRLRLGRTVVRDGRYALLGEIEGLYAWTEQEDFSAAGAPDDRNWRETKAVSLALRPVARVWRELRVSTSFGIQYLRTVRSEIDVREGRVSRLVEGEAGLWQVFGGLSEWDFTVTWDF